MALPIRPSFNNPIPNNPFYSPFAPYVCGPYFPVATSAGIDITTGATVPQLVNDVQNVLTAGPGIALSTLMGVTTITATGGGGGGIPTSIITAKGDLIVGTAANTPVALPIGATDGHVLTVCSACTEGMYWAAGGGGGGATPATPSVEGIIYGCTDCTNFNYGLGDGIFGALTTGTLNIAIGAGALASTDTGTSNTAVGIGALYTNTTGIQNVALGQQALFSGTTGGLNTAIGSQSLQNTTGDANTALGNYAGNTVTTGACNIIIGNQAGGVGAGALDTGCDNVIIGNCLSVASNSGNCQLAIGTSTFCWLSGTSTGAIKPGAGIIDCTGATGGNGQVLMSNGSNAICWGTAGGGGGTPATPTVAGTVFACTIAASHTFLGNCAGSGGGGTSSNTGIGTNSLKVLTGGQFTVALGHEAMATTTATGSRNIAIGYRAANSSTTGVGTSDNVFVGANSGNLLGATALGNVSIGSNTSTTLSTGACNVVIGTSAGQTLTTGTGNVILGRGAEPAAGTDSNTVTFGNPSITTIRAAVTTITSLSDGRDKTDVVALPVGLDFVNTLKPVKFTWQMREPNEVKDGTSEAGFIAQDLKAAQESAGAEYLGLVYESNPEKLEASAGKLLPVLVKAIQELSAKVEALEAKLEANG